MEASIYQSGAYLDANPDWHAADAPFKARWIADLLKKNGIAPQHVVELGSGSGEVLVNLARLLPGVRMDGYDISPQAYAISAPKAGPALAFHHGQFDVARDPAPDVVMAIDVFEHVEDYMGFIRTMRGIAPLQLFHIPLDLSVQGLLRGKSLMHARETVGHLHYFCKDTALATLRDCGLEVIDWTYTRGAEELPGRSLRTRLFNAPRKILRLAGEDLAVRVLGGSSLLVLTR